MKKYDNEEDNVVKQEESLESQQLLSCSLALRPDEPGQPRKTSSAIELYVWKAAVVAVNTELVECKELWGNEL